MACEPDLVVGEAERCELRNFRKEQEGEYYTYFSWEESDTIGVIGVAEVNNQFIGISMPKKKEDDDSYSGE